MTAIVANQLARYGRFITARI